MLKLSFLEKIVSEYQKLKDDSIKLVDRVNELGLKFPAQQRQYIFLKSYQLSNFNFSEEPLKLADLHFEFPEYKVYPLFTRAVSLHTDDKKLINLERKLHEFFVLSYELLSDYKSFEGLKKPNDFLSKKEYINSFVDSFNFSLRFNKLYNHLREAHCIYGKDPKFLVKVDLEPILKEVSNYQRFLDHRISELNSLISLEGKGLNPTNPVSRAFNYLYYERKKTMEIINKYECFKRKKYHLVYNLSKGLDLLSLPFKNKKKVVKSIADLLYETFLVSSSNENLSKAETI